MDKMHYCIFLNLCMLTQLIVPECKRLHIAVSWPASATSTCAAVPAKTYSRSLRHTEAEDWPGADWLTCLWLLFFQLLGFFGCGKTEEPLSVRATVQRRAHNVVTSSQAYGELILHSSKDKLWWEPLYDDEAPHNGTPHHIIHTHTYTHSHTHPLTSNPALSQRQ